MQYVPSIAKLVRWASPDSMLDYGSGNGYQYLVLRVHEEWGGLLPYCYDIGVRRLSVRPDRKFDGVICTDVMEHIAEADVDEVLADIFSFLTPASPRKFMRFVFFGIACRPAKKVLSDGGGAHLCIKPPEWWDARFAKIKMPGVTIKAEYDAG